MLAENAGFIILLRRPLPDGIEVVLGWRGIDDSYVTWLYNPTCDSYFWGHYTTDQLDALRDYMERK